MGINKLSTITLYLLFLVMLWTTFSLKRWEHAEQPNRLIDWDVISYYSYLPATFIHHDISLEFTKDTSKHYEQKHLFWYRVAPNGGRVIKTTMGMSLLFSPFFFIANSSASVLDYEPNGFSIPYEASIVISCLFYLFLGLFYLRKILLLFYNQTITSLILFAVLLGTNMYYYSSSEPGMSHVYSFSLITLFIYHFIKWYETPSYKRALFIGVILGAIILVRPVNIIVLLFPLFYGGL